MGLNLFEGLRAAGASFGQLAGYEGQREDRAAQESALQLREENLARLKNQLDTEHDVKIEGLRGAQTDKNQAAYLDRLEVMQGHQDDRQSKALAASEGRQATMLADQDKRQTDRMDQQLELTTRQQMSQQAQRAAAEHQRAVDDIGKIKSKMAAYLKQQAPLSGLDPENPTSIIDLAKKDPQALSYFQDLRDADRRRREAQAYMLQLPKGPFGAQPPGNGVAVPGAGEPLIPNSTFQGFPGSEDPSDGGP